MSDGIVYYKKDGDNIPILQGVSSPFIPDYFYNKILADFKPTLPLYLFVDGESFRMKRYSDDTHKERS